MARPKKEGMDYFPHDTDAVNDEKIEALRLLYGNDGYAFYFILLERIYRTNNFELDVSDAETIQILSKKVDVNEEKFRQMLETSLKRGCFDQQAYEERKVLTSNGIKKRASNVVEKRVKMREKYQQEKDIVSDAETTQETKVETPQSKEKKSKVKKSKKERDTLAFRENVLLTQKEFDTLVEKYGMHRANMMLDKLNSYKGANEKTYKNDYMAINNWVVEEILKKKPMNAAVEEIGDYQQERKVVSSFDGSLF
jgi:hypothetical protein